MKKVLPFISVAILLTGIGIYLQLLVSEYNYFQEKEAKEEALIQFQMAELEAQKEVSLLDSLSSQIGNTELDSTTNRVIADLLCDKCFKEKDKLSEYCLKALFQTNFVLTTDSLNYEVLHLRYQLHLEMGDTINANKDFDVLTSVGYFKNMPIPKNN